MLARRRPSESRVGVSLRGGLLTVRNAACGGRVGLAPVASGLAAHADFGASTVIGPNVGHRHLPPVPIPERACPSLHGAHGPGWRRDVLGTIPRRSRTWAHRRRNGGWPRSSPRSTLASSRRDPGARRACRWRPPTSRIRSRSEGR
jgi:hypothetical protein